jgi:accessory gene regulator protein AgrB
MGKGGGRMRGLGNNQSSNNGGILGSGIFGFFGTTIKCESTDNSIYCNIMKLFNLLMVVFVVVYILYMAYIVLGPSVFGKNRR